MQRLDFVLKGHILMTEFDRKLLYIIKVDILYLFEEMMYLTGRPDRHLHIHRI